METNDINDRENATNSDGVDSSLRPQVHASEGTVLVKDAAANYLTLDDFEAAHRAAAKKRQVWTAVAIGVAAIVAPVASLMLTGRLTLDSLRRSQQPVAVSTPAPPTPTPIRLSPQEIKVRDAKIASDLKNYVWKQLPAASREEQIANKAFASVTDANYKDDKTSYETIRNVVIPHFSHFVQVASAIQPETEQVKFVHHLMLTSARLRLMAYEEIAAGENDKERLWRPSVRAEFAESTRRAALYQKSIVGLASDTHIKLP